MTDPVQIPDWLPRCTNVVAQGQLKRGSRIKVNFNGRATQFEIVDLTPPTTFGWADREARVGSRVFFHLQFSGGQTQLTMKSLWTPHSWRDRVAGEPVPGGDWRPFLLRGAEDVGKQVQREG